MAPRPQPPPPPIDSPSDRATLLCLLEGSPLHETVYGCILEIQEEQGFEDATEAGRQARSILADLGGGWTDPQGLALSSTITCLPEKCMRELRLHVKADRKGIDLRAAVRPAAEYGVEGSAAADDEEDDDPHLPLPPPSLRARTLVSPQGSTAQPCFPLPDPPASSHHQGSRHGGQ
jgi:hypothetical protein